MDRQAPAVERRGNLALMIIDMLTVSLLARHENRTVARVERRQC